MDIKIEIIDFFLFLFFLNDRIALIYSNYFKYISISCNNNLNDFLNQVVLNSKLCGFAIVSKF